MQEKIKNDDAENYANAEIELEKDQAAGNEQKEDDVKKIEIPGFGEIEYTEKTVMFPEHLVRETDGVRGYKRKIVKWDQFRKLINAPFDLEEGAFMNQLRKEIPKILEFMTDGQFIKQTFNHTFGGHWDLQSNGQKLNQEDHLKNKKIIFQKIADLDLVEKGAGNFSYIILSHEDNKLIDPLEFIKTLDLPSQIKEKIMNRAKNPHQNKDLDAIGNTFGAYLFRDLTSEEKQMVMEDIKKQKVCLLSLFGLSLENRGKLWGNKFFQPIFGFGRRNKVINKYYKNCKKPVCNVERNELKTIQSKSGIMTYNLDKYAILAEDFLRQMASDKSDEEAMDTAEDHCKSISYGNHIHMPIVLNHPNIPELRWCHADYASIPTNKGLNILEMIT